MNCMMCTHSSQRQLSTHYLAGNTLPALHSKIWSDKTFLNEPYRTFSMRHDVTQHDVMKTWGCQIKLSNITLRHVVSRYIG